MADSPPTLSVIIPAYNAARTIGRTLEHLTHAPTSGLKIIVVDDFSTDDTVPLVESLAKQDPRIELLRHPRNFGTFQTRLTGIAHAATDYVGFADSDDWMEGTDYLRMAEKTRQLQADILIFGASRVGPDGREQYRITFPRETLIEADILERFCALEFGPGSNWNKIYRRPVLDEPVFSAITKKLLLNEDYLLNLAAFSRAQRLALVPEVLYHYIDTGTGSSSSSYGARGFIDLYENFADALEVYQPAGDRMLDAIVQLYRHQLAMDYCRVSNPQDLRELRLRLAIAVERISRIRPDFVHAFLHRPEMSIGVKAAVRQLAGEVKRKLFR